MNMWNWKQNNEIVEEWSDLSDKLLNIICEDNTEGKILQTEEPTKGEVKRAKQKQQIQQMF